MPAYPNQPGMDQADHRLRRLLAETGTDLASGSSGGSTATDGTVVGR